ncbi:MAG TPA: hypothetical protein VM096_15415, partial [Vicinamibacterales bacterium]|nr:hypothetical protein [Vicinamibacterales bacterium]
LLAQLGGRSKPTSDLNTTPIPQTPFVNPFADVKLPADDRDPFAVLEKQLREKEQPRPLVDPAALAQLQRDQRVMADLEDWLAAIINDRHNHQASA